MPIEPLRCKFCGGLLDSNLKCVHCGTFHTKVENTVRVMKTCSEHWTKYRKNLVFYTSEECPECVKKRERDLEYDRKLRERNDKEEKKRD